MDKTTIITIGIILLLAAGNVYQHQNPRTIEIPSTAEQIDSTAWVKRSALADKETIIDSLESRNQAMAGRIQLMGDQIATYTSITGRLKTQLDSLQDRPAWNAIPLVDRLTARDSAAVMDTMFTTRKTFGDGLFEVTGTVQIKNSRIRQDFWLAQLRDIRLDVVTTANKDRSRVLTYVTSPDFQDLEYQSYTQLKPKTRLPWFWIGLGTGFAGAVLLL